MVEFEDGAIKAQLGTPDMHLPIGFALLFPRRAARAAEQSASPTTRRSPSRNPTARNIRRSTWPTTACGAAGTAACTMTAANEVAVAAFLAKRCGYLDIVRTIEHALEEATFVARPTLDDYAASDAEARRIAREFLKI